MKAKGGKGIHIHAVLNLSDMEMMELLRDPAALTLLKSPGIY
jgi:hypothetical protein